MKLLIKHSKYVLKQLSHFFFPFFPAAAFAGAAPAAAGAPELGLFYFGIGSLFPSFVSL